MPRFHRQQLGLACEECRRRKARCDRIRPLCGSCQDAGAACCYIDKRPQRGPRKGQMDALKNLVAHLEQRLGEQLGQQQPTHDAVPLDAPQKPDAGLEASVPLENDTAFAETIPMTFPIDLENNNFDSAAFGSTILGSASFGSTSLSSTSLERTPVRSSSLVSNDMNSIGRLDRSPSIVMSDQNSNSDWLNNNPILSPSATTPQNSNNDWLDNNTILSHSTTTSRAQQSFVPEHMQPLSSSTLSDLMQIDLDEVYFDRVHPVAPNIHKRNYFAWASQKILSPAQIALQYAMRAVAAAVSAQYRSLSSMICAESRRVLERMDANGAGDSNSTSIEQIQAWLLVAHCELLCKHEHQAMLTAGRAIRMVQLARLHDVDAYNVSFMSVDTETPLFPPSPLSEDESFAEAEGKRRTFWLAYCFDRFCLMRSECPPSLQDELIRTRLPAPEANFQNNQPIRMDFLPEALALSGRAVLPPFAECVVLNSLFSRCMLHQRLALTPPVSAENDSRKFWSKHAWLTLPIEKRKQLLAQGLPGATDYVDDPMLTFVHVLAGCAAICVNQSMAHVMPWPTVDQEATAPAYEEQAVKAASELVHFVQMMPRSISHFKAHPFLPTLMHRTAIFLKALPRSPNSTKIGYNDRDGDLSTLLDALGNLRQINNLARDSLYKLEKDTLCMT